MSTRNKQYSLHYLKLDMPQVGSRLGYLLEIRNPCAHIVVARHSIVLVQIAVILEPLNNQSSNLSVAAGVTIHLLRNGAGHAVAISTALDNHGVVRRSILLQREALLIATVHHVRLFFMAQSIIIGRILSLGPGRLNTASGLLRLLVARRRLVVGQQASQFCDECLRWEVKHCVKLSTLGGAACLRITMTGGLGARLLVLSARPFADGFQVQLGQLLQRRNAEREVGAHAGVNQSISKRSVSSNCHVLECSALKTDT